jgi:hypothetical protein
MVLRMIAPKSIRRLGSRITALLGLVLAIFLLAAVPARALENISQTTTDGYLPDPPGQAGYRLVVIGDSLGNGVWRGLNEAFRGEQGIRIERRSRVSTGLVRDDYYDWPEELEKILGEESIQIAVVLFGTNDKQAIRADRGNYRTNSPEWQREYRSRVDRIMEQLSGRGIAVYWIGLPIMRSPSFSAHAARVNAVVRESAAEHGIKFVDTWDEFADDEGQYNAYGPDIRGRTRRLRMDDGIHFTGPGDRMLAHTVERVLRADLVNATTGSVPNGGGNAFPPPPTARPSRSSHANITYDRLAQMGLSD